MIHFNALNPMISSSAALLLASRCLSSSVFSSAASILSRIGTIGLVTASLTARCGVDSLTAPQRNRRGKAQLAMCIVKSSAISYLIGGLAASNNLFNAALALGGGISLARSYYRLSQIPR
ncbi:MAG: hypothetical protein JSS32_02300 [Verrucomicrobia bacterium]|nr:hypothetical protein [Verrucomicrobiota bacterium]